MAKGTGTERVVRVIGHRKGVLLIVLGFALVLNPHLVGALDSGDSDRYRYEAGQVTFHPNGTVDAPTGVHDLDSDVACLEAVPTRSCVLEIAVYRNGGVDYDGPSDQFLQSPYRYVYLHGEGFYEPVAIDSRDGPTHYDLEPASRIETLDAVSTPIERASHGVETAIREGSYETSDSLEDAHELIRTDGAYHVVYPTRVETNGEPDPIGNSIRETGLALVQWVLGIAGAGAILYGQRCRVERDDH
jgi:hypothetical protein